MFDANFGEMNANVQSISTNNKKSQVVNIDDPNGGAFVRPIDDPNGIMVKMGGYLNYYLGNYPK